MQSKKALDAQGKQILRLKLYLIIVRLNANSSLQDVNWIVSSFIYIKLIGWINVSYYYHLMAASDFSLN